MNIELALFVAEIQEYLYDTVKHYNYDTIEDYLDDITDASVEIDIVSNLTEAHINFTYNNVTYIICNLFEFKHFHNTLINKLRKTKLNRII